MANPNDTAPDAGPLPYMGGVVSADADDQPDALPARVDVIHMGGLQAQINEQNNRQPAPPRELGPNEQRVADAFALLSRELAQLDAYRERRGLDRGTGHHAALKLLRRFAAEAAEVHDDSDVDMSGDGEEE